MRYEGDSHKKRLIVRGTPVECDAKWRRWAASHAYSEKEKRIKFIEERRRKRSGGDEKGQPL